MSKYEIPTRLRNALVNYFIRKEYPNKDWYNLEEPKKVAIIKEVEESLTLDNLIKIGKHNVSNISGVGKKSLDLIDNMMKKANKEDKWIVKEKEEKYYIYDK